jgi:hypothetical protein
MNDPQPTSLMPVNQTAAPTPLAMLQQAVQGGATIEVLERLMALQERWQAHEARKAFDNSMAECRADLPKIIKNQKVDFVSLKGIRTNYKYEDLSEVVETVAPVMAKHGLSFRWRTDSTKDGLVSVTCILSHRQGHSEDTTLAGPYDQSGNKNPIQAIGSVVTYLQRYTLKAALGVAAGHDDDGRSAGEAVPDRQTALPPRNQPPPATKAPPLTAKPTAKPVGKAKSKDVLPEATEKTREWMFRELGTHFAEEDVEKYARDAGLIMPTESLADWPLHKVPTSKQDLAKLVSAMGSAILGEPDPAGEADERTESFWDVIITLPRAGTKRDEYLKSPDTIRSLYDAMKSGDEAAGKRLWGTANYWKLEPWTGRDGQTHPPSEADVAAREALNDFLEYEAEKHGESFEDVRGDSN